MADEIRQQLTFDASNAINELGRLDKSLESSRTSLEAFGRSLSSFNRNASGVESTLNRIAGAAGNLQGSLRGGLIPQQAVANVQRTTGLVDQFGNSLNKQASQAVNTNAANTRAASSTRGVGAAAGAARPQVAKLTVGFATLGRIITTQLTVRLFAGFLQGLKDATAGAIEFQKRVAEIQSIANGSFETFDEVAASVRRISDAFNQPLGEVQEGLYQIISNQIQGAANQIQVLETSANLAKVGVAKLSDTVDLMTGTINAFQLDAADANRIAAVFFETVRLGRVTVSDLATSFGTVATLAGEAGIEFEEAAAAFATITINGLDAAKAATQLRGIINGFIKPTAAMTEVLREAGFETGEQAIQTLGLAGAMGLLQKATGGNTTELAKLIPRVRGLSGALVLARKDGKTLNDTVDVLRQSSSDLLREKLDIRLETNAEQVESQLNRISNTLTVDLGQAILATINNFLNAVDAASSFGTAVTVLGPALITIATAGGAAALALVGYAAAAKLSTFSTATLSKATITAYRSLRILGLNAAFARKSLLLLNAATLIAVGFTAGFQIGEGLIDSLNKKAKEAGDQAAKTLSKQLIDGSIGQDADIDRRNTQNSLNNIRKITKAQQESLNQLRRQETERERIFIDTNDAILTDTERLFDALVKANRDLLNSLEDQRDSAEKAQTSSIERQTSLRDTISDRAFQQSIKRAGEQQKVFALEARGAQIAAQANRALAEAQDDQGAQSAIGQLQRADSFLQEAEAIAESTGNLSLQNKIFQTRQRLSQQTLRSEQQFAATQRQIQTDAEAVLKVEKARVAELNRQVDEAKEAIRVFQQADNPADRIEALRRAREEISDITPELAFGRNALQAGGGLDFRQLIDFSSFTESLQDELQSANLSNTLGELLGGAKLDALNERFVTESAAAIITGVQLAQNTLNAQGLKFNAEIDLSLIGSEQLQQVINQLVEASQIAKDDLTFSLQNRDNQRARDIAGQAAIKGAASDFNEIDAVTSFLFRGANEQTTKFRNNLIELAQDAIGLGNNLENLSFGDVETQLNDIQQRLTTLLDESDVGDRLNTSALRAQIDGLINRLRAANQQGLPKALQDAEGINQQLQAIPNASASFTQNLERAVALSAQINTNLNTPGSVANAALGGRISRFAQGGRVNYFANGGFAPRGTDTIPAMLSPGEFVVNARSTRRFYSQLQALNAGIQPVYRQEGGPVTNFGDINVNVPDSRRGGNTSNMGREIAVAIRRELRRGTSRL
jgi:TP901 family phage tail tape measure protein